MQDKVVPQRQQEVAWVECSASALFSEPSCMNFLEYVKVMLF
jgi:hypothetical protein